MGRCIDEDNNFEEAAAKISTIVHKLDKTEGKFRKSRNCSFRQIFQIILLKIIFYNLGLVPIFINANSAGSFEYYS